MVVTLVSISGLSSRASLNLYDQSLAADEIGRGPVPISKLTSATSLNGSNSFAFNFGTVSGESTFEFIVEGDPVAGGRDGYLAVGSNSSSSLRYEQWSDTGQLGFTQSGVAAVQPLALQKLAQANLATSIPAANNSSESVNIAKPSPELSPSHNPLWLVSVATAAALN